MDFKINLRIGEYYLLKLLIILDDMWHFLDSFIPKEIDTQWLDEQHYKFCCFIEKDN